MQADQIWCWRGWSGIPLDVGWSHRDHRASGKQQSLAVVLIHGFGANTNHWRHNVPALSAHAPTYALDLIGFGQSSQPRALLKGEENATDNNALEYSFDLWGEQVASFCREVVQQPVLLVGNSIGGVVALRAAQLLDSEPGSSPCNCLLYTSPSPRDRQKSRMPSSA